MVTCQFVILFFLWLWLYFFNLFLSNLMDNSYSNLLAIYIYIYIVCVEFLCYLISKINTTKLHI